jgi:spermidine/putrescine transport system permease protein
MMKNLFFKNFFSKQFPFFVSVPALLWQILFLCLPLLALISAAFFKPWRVFDFSAVSMESFVLVCNMLHLKIILSSILLALLICALCLLIGYPVAYFFAIKMRKYKTFFLFFITLPFWINFLVQTYAWFFVLERQGLINTILLKLNIIAQPLQILYTPYAVALVMVYCYVPFMILPLYGALEKFDVRLIEASLDLGATPTKTFFKVTLPLTMSGISNGFFLVFVPVFGEYAIPAIMGGGKSLYVGTLISAYFLESHNPSLGAAFTVLSSIAVACVALFFYWLLRVPTPAPNRQELR